VNQPSAVAMPRGPPTALIQEGPGAALLLQYFPPHAPEQRQLTRPTPQAKEIRFSAHRNDAAECQTQLLFL
jgi:hypothetical protein